MEFPLLAALGQPLWMWLLFFIIVVALLTWDLGVLHKDDHEIGVKESLGLSAMYIALGVAFAGFIWWRLDAESAAQYLTAFIVEKSLSMDNIFVMAMIFGYFGVPRRYQHRVLFWGVLGVILLRGVVIALGSALVEQYHWVLYLFAAFLIFTGVKLLVAQESEPDLKDNAVLQFLKRRFRVTDEIRGREFFVMRREPSGRMARYATPLFLALILIEVTDLIFAFDSIPAVFAITTDPYVVFTSNIFAILGLRALFFALSAILHRFAQLKYALSLLLVFIGAKVFVAELMGWEKFPPAWSLGVTFAILGAGVVFSLWRTRRAEAADVAPEPEKVREDVDG